MGIGRSAVGLVVLLAATIAAGLLALGVTLSSAATPLPTLTLDVAPRPTVATSENVLGILKFSYPANASPTTLTGTFVEVTITPALSSSAEFNSGLSSSFCSLQSLSIVRCNLGNVRKGDDRTMFVVVSAPSGTSISMEGTAFWNENVKGKNPQPNNMVESDPPSLSTNVVSGTANANGKCTLGGSTLATNLQLGTGNQVTTQATYSANSQGLPCTPVSVEDDIAITVTSVVCTASPCVGALVTLPLLLSSGTVTITFDGSLFPPPGPAPNPNTFVVYESLDGITAEPVPLCSTGETSFGTCQLDAVKFGVRGIQVTLQVFPTSGIDPNYWG